MNASLRNLLFTLCLTLLFSPKEAAAQSYIRDAEIEHTLKTFGEPLFKAAGVTPEHVRFFIIQDDAINAFVAGGSNMFIYTGMLKAATEPGMLLGVMAHETGHIAGGHLAQGTEKLANAQLGAILSSVVGLAIMAGGSPDAGQAVLQAGSHVAGRGLLSFSRTNENAADQAALQYLDDNHFSASGMLKMFEVLRQHEQRQFGTPDPYALTHPLTKERITSIRSHVMQSSIPEGQMPKDFPALHGRLLAKLNGFVDAPERTFMNYPESDQSLEARYARAIAWYKVPNVEKALKEIDSLLKEHPKDPFFHELKGQILFENGRIRESLTSYQKAVDLYPGAALIRTDLAKAQLGLNEPAMLNAAVVNLERASQDDSTNATTWKLLGTAYGKQNRMGMADLALAEAAMLRNKPEEAKQLAERAMEKLDASSPSRLRAADLKLQAEKAAKDKDDP